MVYLIQRGDAQSFTLARDIDPAYAAAYQTAREAGVEMLRYACRLTPEGLAGARQVPLVEGL